MTDLVKQVTNTLADIGIPVIFQAYPAGHEPPPQYITFIEYFAEPELQVGDRELATERMIQVNVWSKTDYHSLVNQVRQTLESAEFERLIEYDAPYQDGDSHYNKVLRFRYLDEY